MQIRAFTQPSRLMRKTTDVLEKKKSLYFLYHSLSLSPRRNSSNVIIHLSTAQ